jgi:hypothetical protein
MPFAFRPFTRHLALLLCVSLLFAALVSSHARAGASVLGASADVCSVNGGKSVSAPDFGLPAAHSHCDLCCLPLGLAGPGFVPTLHTVVRFERADMAPALAIIPQTVWRPSLARAPPFL